MEEWGRQNDAARLSVRPVHDDAVRLARDLVVAVHEAHPAVDPGIVQLSVTGGSRLGSVFVDAFLAELADVRGPFVLALDDLHAMTNTESLSDLGDLVVGLPDNVRMVIASRWDQPLHVGRLRLEDRLVELRLSDLAFESDEAVGLLEGVSGRSMSPGHVETLVSRTEGWAAGLQLAALSLQKQADVDAFVAGFTGDDRLVADYLTDEVVRSLDPSMREFVLRTSVLEWLSPDLCEAVTGQDDARATLLSLRDRGLFLTRVEGVAERFRYHHLFADLLRFQLRGEAADAEVECRRRAARWLLANGEHRAGVEQLLAAGDYVEAFEVVAVQGHRLFERGETATLASALAAIHNNITTPSAQMSISLLASQVASDQFSAAAETYRMLARQDLSPGEQIAADTLGAILGLGDLPVVEMRRLATGVLRLLPTVQPESVFDFFGAGGAESCEVMAGTALALADLFDADLASSSAGFTSALELPGAKYPMWRINILGMSAFTHAAAGRLTEAEGCALAAVDTAREVGAMDHVAVAMAQLALGAVALERLNHGLAGVHLDAAARIVAHCHRPIYHHLLQLLKTRHIAAVRGIQPALTHLRDMTFGGPQRLLVTRARLSLEAQLLVRSGAVREAHAVLGAAVNPTPAASFDVLVADGDVPGARRVLEAWQVDADEPRSALAWSLREAVLMQCDGHAGLAGTAIADAAVDAEVEGLLAPFLETPRAQNILRTMAPSRPLRRMKHLLDSAPSDDGRLLANAALIEPLTPRELTILAYLPSRLSNDEIADALFVSVNTLRTHLRSIYRKLGASGRDAAVASAAMVGLT
ncbi:LuxR C-terminal-related transcriptional regulator [Solicola gregarius]|uniref:LuxR C-terminal-related transcriptional regulator n=1 Tax=Solicola gregarius TaxID=2908642 RepID=A0AA46TFD1_9ACTN|nr:LuxR C-terminal-related transcriptional regulator [Solicola gregarius]UYM03548.1 LuxR C-terminal-related transcriptional regulator [Solicola gregarius]